MHTVRRAAALKALWTAVSGRRTPGGPSVGRQLSALPRLVAATMSGRYPGTTRARLGLMALALLYVVSPVDLVPEAALLLLGMADDAMVLAWLAGSVLTETDAFLAWETGAASPPPGSGPGSPGRSAGPSAGASGPVVPGEVVR